MSHKQETSKVKPPSCNPTPDPASGQGGDSGWRLSTPPARPCSWPRVDTPLPSSQDGQSNGRGYFSRGNENVSVWPCPSSPRTGCPQAQVRLGCVRVREQLGRSGGAGARRQEGPCAAPGPSPSGPRALPLSSLARRPDGDTLPTPQSRQAVNRHRQVGPLSAQPQGPKLPSSSK